MKIVGITGTLGAGKTTIVETLKTLGYAHFSIRSYLTAELERLGLETTRDEMVKLANELRALHGPGAIVLKMYQKIVACGEEKAIIESIRAPGEVEALAKMPHYELVAIDAEPSLRYERIAKRASSTDSVSFEQFLKDEEREMGSAATRGDPGVQNLAFCVAAATHVFLNNGGPEELKEAVLRVFKASE